MEVSCSFRSLVGGICGFDKKDRNPNTQIIPLVSCNKNISKHVAALAFRGTENEIDLILCRAGLFNYHAERIRDMTICPHHRAVLGISWTRGSSTRCRVPKILSGHGNGKGSWPKGDRGISKIESRVILCKTGIFVQVGSGKLNELSIMIISAASTASETNISCKNTIFIQVFVENAEKK